MDIGGKIKELRVMTGLTQEELAEKLEISKSCLNHRMRKIEELASKISAK